MKHLNWKRVAAGALSLVLVAGTPALLLTGVIGTKASATSLPYIESIVTGLKGSSNSFHILEIVPQAGAGSIGYYVAGQEPSSSWGQTLGAITKGTQDSSGAYASAAAERAQKMTSIMNSLSSASLMGTGTDTPLTKTSDYSEVLPWARAAGSGYSALQLNHREKCTVSGTFTKKAEGSASAGFDYTQQTTYTIVAGGSYIQNISEFIPVNQSTDAADTYFYYSPVFTALDEAVADGIADKTTPVYTNTATQANPSATPDPAGYVYYGTLKDGLESGKKYYYVTSTGAPSATQSANSYKARLDPTDPYQQVSSNGYFNLTVTGYTYVGDGKGVYSFAPGAGGSFGITYDTVYYTGGYTNNNWFLTKVLDVASGDVGRIHVQVDSLTPAGLSDAVQSQIAADYYDLIVLSGGFLPGGGAIAPYSSSNDLTAGAKTALATAANSTNKTPVVVDRSLVTSYAALNIGSLAVSLAGSGSPATFAEGNIYVINSALATNQLSASFLSSQFNVSGAPFYDVYYEIYHENFLRKTENPSTTDLLPETVSMANSIRYIINYRQQRPVTKKTSIRVLEIEPGRGSDSTTNSLKTQIRTWTGLPATLPDGVTDPITIDRISTSEFIGKIDDLIEKYDMIYVGADLTGFNLSSGSTVYNDTTMNGLIYSNIGDEWVTSSYKISGLLDRDYSPTQKDSSNYQKINAADATRTFRLSGNDITETKVQELENFAAAGHPVVVSNNLMYTVPALASDFTFAAQLSNSSGTLTASYSPSALPNGLTASYQWFKDASAITGATGSTYTPTLDAGAGTYTCQITIGGMTATSNAANVSVVTQNYSASAANPDQSSSGVYTSTSSQDYTITITRASPKSGYYTYTIDFSPKSSSPTVSYQWYYYNAGQWSKVSGAQAASYATTKKNDSNYYYCEVTINGNPCISQYASPSGYQSGKQSATYSIPVSVQTSFSANVTTSGNSSYASLTASCAPTVSSYVLYRWINASSGAVSQAATLTATSGTSYCMVYVYSSATNYNSDAKKDTPTKYDASARSNNYTISGGQRLSIAVSGSGGSATVAAHDSYLSVQTATVDNSSKVYEFLSYAANRKNTFLGASGLDTDMLVQYLNLSAPKINLTAAPTEYTGTSSANAGGRTLTYQFTISNETDITPISTRYDCNFYIDSNADGKYSDSEQLADILITDSSGATLSSGELQAGVSYTVTRRLPPNYAGILPWKLEVIKVGDESVHASRIGYTRIAPDNNSQKTSIKILQLLSSNGIASSSLNLISNSTYLGLFPSAADFDLTISTISISNFNGSSYTVSTRNVSSTTSTTTSETYASRAALLDHYDMLVLGFADCYGDLNSTAAAAVTGFINSGKSVLFTHDTTSICNLPKNGYSITSGTVDQGSYYWGYNFNTIVRDAVKLDRYGVTNSTVGVTQYSPNKSGGSQSFNVAAGESSLTSANLQALTTAGYSIAYQPGSAGASTLDEVQGVVSTALVGQTNSTTSQFLPTSDANTYFQTDGGNYITTSVSQVNQGQITTYPFNLNMKGFTTQTNSSTAPLYNQTVMTIAPTHNQYYQLNMNSDDIVVWYCLADGSSSRTSDNIYGCTPNDVMNNYYIYSVGNVTYSGAGHSGNSVSTYEAELFINTMIAAYRPAHTNPAIEIVSSAAGTTPISSYYLTADYSKQTGSVYSSALVEKSADCPVYFKITDTNLDSDRRIVISISNGATTYTYGTGTNALKIYRVNAGIERDLNNTNSIFTDHVYYFYLPKGVLDSFGASTNYNTEPLTVQVSTVFPDSGTSLSGSTALTLQKIGLLDLG